MSEEWGPWIDHDGKGCPVQHGTFVHVKGVYREKMGFAGQDGGKGWEWVLPDHTSVIRYRVRKPRALQQLIEMVENLPAPKINALTKES